MKDDGTYQGKSFRYGVIDSNGKWVVEPKEIYPESQEEYSTGFYAGNGLFGAANHNGDTCFAALIEISTQKVLFVKFDWERNADADSVFYYSNGMFLINAIVNSMGYHHEIRIGRDPQTATEYDTYKNSCSYLIDMDGSIIEKIENEDAAPGYYKDGILIIRHDPLVRNQDDKITEIKDYRNGPSNVKTSYIKDYYPRVIYNIKEEKIVMRLSGKDYNNYLAVSDLNGNLLFEPIRVDDVLNATDYIVCRQTDGKMAIYDLLGNAVATDLDYSCYSNSVYPGAVSSGLVRVVNDDFVGYINPDGTVAFSSVSY